MHFTTIRIKIRSEKSLHIVLQLIWPRSPYICQISHLVLTYDSLELTKMIDPQDAGQAGRAAAGLPVYLPNQMHFLLVFYPNITNCFDFRRFCCVVSGVVRRCRNVESFTFILTKNRWLVQLSWWAGSVSLCACQDHLSGGCSPECLGNHYSDGITVGDACHHFCMINVTGTKAQSFHARNDQLVMWSWCSSKTNCPLWSSVSTVPAADPTSTMIYLDCLPIAHCSACYPVFHLSVGFG